MSFYHWPPQRSIFQTTRVIVPVAAGDFGLQLKYSAAAVAEDIWRIGVLSLEVALSTAVASTMALAYPTTQGTSNPSPPGGYASNIAIGSNVELGIGAFDHPYNPRADIATAWSVEPTITLPAVDSQIFSVVGETILWEWPEDDPLVIPVTGSLVLYNAGLAISGQMLANIRWTEAPVNT